MNYIGIHSGKIYENYDDELIQECCLIPNTNICLIPSDKSINKYKCDCCQCYKCKYKCKGMFKNCNYFKDNKNSEIEYYNGG